MARGSQLKSNVHQGGTRVKIEQLAHSCQNSIFTHFPEILKRITNKYSLDFSLNTIILINNFTRINVELGSHDLFLPTRHVSLVYFGLPY